MNWMVVFFGAGLVTFLTRLSFIALFGKIRMPPLLARALRFVPPAVLTAVIFPELILHSGNFDISPGNLRLIAGIIAVLVALKTRKVLVTIAAGMAVLWALQWLAAVV